MNRNAFANGHVRTAPTGEAAGGQSAGEVDSSNRWLLGLKGLERDAEAPVDPGAISQENETASPVMPALAPGVESETAMEIARPRSGLAQALAALTDRVAAIPAPAPIVWALSAGAIVVLAILRLLLHRRDLRGAAPAPAIVQQSVAHAAGLLGLRRVPRAYFVDRRVSPMICCGLPPRLVLPRELWTALDEEARQAVLVHELAHLKRRDHWVCYVEMLVALAYWWHPVTWWARRALREEADLCCDAWVTRLLPTQRRTYAQALLATRIFLDSPGPMTRRTPALLGLGMASPRSRRFARRLTMVMIDRNGPKMSLRGVTVAAGVAAAGLVILPALTCPPSSNQTPEAAATPLTYTTIVAAPTPVATAGYATAVATLAPSASSNCTLGAAAGAAVACPPEDGQHKDKHHKGVAVGASPAPRAIVVEPGHGSTTTFERHMQGRFDDAAMQELEARLRAIEERFEQLERAMHGMHGHPGASVPQIERIAPALQELRTQLHGALSPEAVEGLVAQADIPVTVYGTGGQDAVALYNLATADNGETVSRSYRLPEGKLQEFTELMIRSDVPILVTPGEGEITVHATSRQHAIFEAFLRLIDPENQPAPTAGGGAGFGGGGAFLIPGDDRCAPARGALMHGAHEAEIQARAEAMAQREQARHMRANARALENEMRARERQAQSFERQADRVRERADRMNEQADDLRAHMDGSVDESAMAEFESRLADLLAQIETLLAEADALTSEAETQAVEAERIAAEAEAIEAQADDFEALAESIEEEALTAIEAAMEAAELDAEAAAEAAEEAAEWSEEADEDEEF